MKTSTLVKETNEYIIEKRLTKNKDTSYTLNVPKTLKIFERDYPEERILHFTQWGFRQVMDKKHLSKGTGALDKDTITSLPDKALKEMEEVLKAHGKDINLVAKKKQYLEKEKGNKKNGIKKNGSNKNGKVIIRKKETSETPVVVASETPVTPN